jgi:NifB/MoaA-like Fe-S oxidoreductase
MLRHENDLFLDDMHIDMLAEKLGVKVTAVNNDGYELIYKILGKVQ